MLKLRYLIVFCKIYEYFEFDSNKMFQKASWPLCYIILTTLCKRLGTEEANYFSLDFFFF